MKRLALLLVLMLGTSSALAAPAKGRAREYDRPSYGSSSDQYNFRFGPISLLVGALHANFDVLVTPEWTIGPELDYAKVSYGAGSGFTTGYEISAMGLGVRGNWFKEGFHNDGLYVGPSLSYYSLKLTSKDTFGTSSGEASGAVIRCLVGYGWFWESFNQMLGIGASAGLGNLTVKSTSSTGTTSEVSGPIGSGLALEYSLGWTF